MISLKDHLDYPVDVHQIVRNRQFNELLKFTNFSFCLLFRDLIDIINSAQLIIVKHVIDNIIDINSCAHGYDLIHYLIEIKNLKLFNHYVDKYFIDLDSISYERTTAIYYAVCNGRLDMVDFLINKGVNLEVSHLDGNKPIHEACENGSLEIIKLLLNKGVDLESQNNNGWRPIHFVCRHRNYDIIKLLLSKNINLESRIITRYNDNNVDCGVKDLLLMNKNLNSEEQQELLDIIDKKLNFAIIDYPNI